MKSRLLGAQGHAGDGESLQTDVMRFMAIIGFCLIAILALVRNVETAPEAPQASAPLETAAVMEASAPTPAPSVKAAQARGSESRRPDTSVPAAVPEKTVMVESQPLSAAAVVAEPAAELPMQLPDAPAAELREQTLSLRFASGKDFSRLVSKGEIHVYAFQAGRQVFGLARNFQFNQAKAPGRLYELMPDTIPSSVLAALGQVTREPVAFTWGVRLPADLERRIRRYVDEAAVGELVIDRYGEVHHVAG